MVDVYRKAIKRSDHNNGKVSRAELGKTRRKRWRDGKRCTYNAHVWMSLHSLPETRKATWNYYPTLCEQQVSLNQLHVVHLVYRAAVYRRGPRTHGIFKETLSKVVPRVLLFAASRRRQHLPDWNKQRLPSLASGVRTKMQIVREVAALYSRQSMSRRVIAREENNLPSRRYVNATTREQLNVAEGRGSVGRRWENEESGWGNI